MMNLFIDSNILFQDYFFENKSNKIILEYCKNGLLNLFMSDIVMLELRRQFTKEIEAKNIEIKKIIRDSNRLKIKNNFNEISLEDQLKSFDRQYKILSQIDNFKLLSYKNEFLPDIVNRSVNRIKPFTENKTELKDALIWKTYTEYAETNNLSNCILLTNNTNDFCKGNDKSKIHPDLLKDSNKFTVINSSFEFIKTKASVIESPENKFQAYISQTNIDNITTLGIIQNNFTKQIEKSILEYTESLHPSDILDRDYIIDGHAIGSGVEILDCDDVDYQVISQKALVSGIVYVSCEVELEEYNASRDPGEDAYSYLAEIYITYKVYFNFDIRINSAYSEFEITNINIHEVQ